MGHPILALHQARAQLAFQIFTLLLYTRLSFPPMAELIWDGKYTADRKKQAPVRIALPFQTIETVNESAQERQRSLEMFSSGRDSEWRNRLIWGDKKYVLPSLLPEFAGKVDLIYIDPPFDTGSDFSFTASIPSNDEEEDGVLFEKEPSVLEQKAYRDTWGRGLDSYLSWISETAALISELLTTRGSLYVHIGTNVSHYVKAVLDEYFPGQFVNEIVWKRQTAKSGAFEGLAQYGRIHEAILFYAKSADKTWNPQFTAYDAEYVRKFYKYTEEGTGRRFQLGDLTAAGVRRGDSGGSIIIGRDQVSPAPGRHWALGLEKNESVQQACDRLVKEGRIMYQKGQMPRYKQYLDEMPGVLLQDIWNDVPPVASQSIERLSYDTQKPEALLERIIKASSMEGNLVLDCFAGSGTTAAVSEKLNRKWITCDLGRFAIHTTRKRLLGIPGVKPFVVQNLGKYERQMWQAAEFPSNGKDHLQEQRDREAAYRRFILDLYHATETTGGTWLNGVKGGKAVHVGAVDAPVTLADVKAIAKEAWKSLGKEGQTNPAVDILGWEFAFEVNETAKQVAAESRVAVSFKKIPYTVLEKKAVEQGDIQFFELGALEIASKIKGRAVTLELKDFAIPTDDIPEEVRHAIKNWNQLVDYWAVDWDFKGDTFHNQWQSYRTRKDPKIQLKTEHTYESPGKYSLLVKVIDILGNDTTKTLQVEVK